MALNLCNAAVNAVQSLDNTPTIAVDQLKATFDKSASNIKEWLNDTFIPELDDVKQDKISNPAKNRVVITDASGSLAESEITSTELNALDGINSNIQEQLNTLQGKITYGTAAPSGGSNGDIYIQYS